MAVAPILEQSAAAHDIWLQTDQFSLEKGDDLIVRQLVGANLTRDLLQPRKARELPVLLDMTPRFSLITEDGSIDLLAELLYVRANLKPVLDRRLDFEGLALVTMEHALIYTEHSNDEFFDYLEHERFPRGGFEPHMGSRSVQTEAYQRTLKLLVQVGEPASTPAVFGQALGQPIEIVLLQNPYRLNPGDDLDVRVLFGGEPLDGAEVSAYNSDGTEPVVVSRVRTNDQGVARFPLDRAGSWLLRLVHMVPCSEVSAVDCEDAAWSSYWTAYSFEIE